MASEQDQLSQSVEYVAVEFDLPYVLDVVDSIDFDAVPEHYQDYMFSIDHLPVLIRFRRRRRRIGAARVLQPEDPRRPLEFTTARCIYDRSFFRRFTIRKLHIERCDELVASALGAINFFLEGYRRTTDRHWIRPLTRSEMPAARFYGILKDGKRVNLPQSPWEPETQTSETLSEDQDRDLREWVVQGYQADPVQRLAYAVRDMFDRGSFWGAAAGLDALTRAKVARMFRAAFKSKSLNAEQIKERFMRDEHEPYGPIGLIDNYLQEMTGVAPDAPDHGIGPAYETWRHQAHALARRIHRGKLAPVTKQQAAKAMAATAGLFEALESLLPDVARTVLVPRAAEEAYAEADGSL